MIPNRNTMIITKICKVGKHFEILLPVKTLIYMGPNPSRASNYLYACRQQKTFKIVCYKMLEKSDPNQASQPLRRCQLQKSFKTPHSKPERFNSISHRSYHSQKSFKAAYLKPFHSLWTSKTDIFVRLMQNLAHTYLESRLPKGINKSRKAQMHS